MYANYTSNCLYYILVYSLHYIVYIVHYTVYSVHYTIYSAYYQRPLCPRRKQRVLILYTVHLHNSLNRLYTIQCTMYIIQCTVYIIHYTNNSIDTAGLPKWWTFTVYDTRTHTHTHTHTCTYTHTYTHICTNKHTNTHTYTHIYTNIHTHIHTQNRQHCTMYSV